MSTLSQRISALLMRNKCNIDMTFQAVLTVAVVTTTYLSSKDCGVAFFVASNLSITCNSNSVLYGEKVPVIFVVFILIGYTALGAVVLRTWEDWSFFDSFYYCFITVTTVGFGDIIPQRHEYLQITLLYIVTGLVITTMCIDLVGSQYIRKIHFFANTLVMFFGRNIRKARFALAQMGGRMLHIGDMLRYVSVMQKRYGLTEEDLAKLAEAPDEFLLDCILRGRPLPPQWQGLFTKPFVPLDFPYLKWIDSRPSWRSENVLASQDSSEICSTARTPRDYITQNADGAWVLVSAR